jgi:DNA-binding IclR family transcriptional regulator
MTTPNHVNRPVKTVERTFDIIELIRERGGCRISEVAEELELANSTVHDHLTTLVAHKYLIKEGQTYRLGLKFLEFGMLVRNHMEIVEVAEPHIDELARETKEKAWLTVEDYGEDVPLHMVAGEHAVQLGNRIGSRMKLYHTAGGKAMLAHLPEKRVEEIIDRYGLEELTGGAVESREELASELEKIRQKGYATMNGEIFQGIRSVGGPIITEKGVEGAVVVSGAKHRMRGERFHEEVPEQVLATTNEIELKLSYDTQQ